MGRDRRAPDSVEQSDGGPTDAAPSGGPTPPPPAATVGEAAKRLLPWLVAVALFMESLDTTILNTAVPTIAKALQVAPLAMKAALTSYTLSLAVFIPISGWVADRFGTRRVFFSAIGVFTIGSLLCGLSVDLSTLVASRIIQGIGGAMMMPVGRITMVRTFPKGEFIRATAFVAIPALIGPLIGPLAGGLIVAYWHWRMIFYVNLPIGVIGIFLAHRFMPDYRTERREPLDIVGLTLFGAGVALVSYVLEVFGEHALSLRSELFLLAVGLALLVAYVLYARRIPHPLLKLGYFRIRTFRASIAGSFITRLGVGGMPFLLPLLYQIGLGHTPVGSGLLIMPQPLAAMGLRAFMPRILKAMGYRRLLLLNTVGLGLLIMSFATIAPGTSVWYIVALATAFGFLSSLQYTSMNTLAFADITGEQASMASSIVSTAQQMSMSFGVAIGSLATVFFTGGERDPSQTRMIAGIHHTFLFLGGLTIVSALVFRQLRPDDGAAMSLHEADEH